jgi:hypothetical protein
VRLELGVPGLDLRASSRQAAAQPSTARGAGVPADIGCGEEGLALGAVPGDRAEGVDDERDELVAGYRPDLVEPSQ